MVSLESENSSGGGVIFKYLCHLTKHRSVKPLCPVSERERAAGCKAILNPTSRNLT